MMPLFCPSRMYCATSSTHGFKLSTSSRRISSGLSSSSRASSRARLPSAVEEAHQLARERFEAAVTTGYGLKHLRESLAPVREHLLEHRAPQRLLGRVVVQQRLLGDADALGDRL